MPSHADRVRRNYACPVCYGDGWTDCCGEDRATCHACGGSGVLLTPYEPPRARAGDSRFVTPLRVVDTTLRAMAKNLTVVRHARLDREGR